MPLTVKHVTFDTTDARRSGAWWKIDEPTPGKNRIHLDISAGPDRVAEVERAVTLGAAVVAEHGDDHLHWTVLADPDGNQFCISD
jgi:hypothetical protein